MNRHSSASFRHRRARILPLAVAAGLLVLLSSGGRADALIEPGDCGPGHLVGLAVTAGGDFNGDGIPDFAYAAPCARVRGIDRAGAVTIRNGKNGRVLRRIRGNQAEMLLGTALAFVGDLNNDGADELAIGTPYYDDIDPAQPGVTLTNIGQVRVVTSARRGPVLRVTGVDQRSGFGASVAGIADLNNDSRRDLLVGAVDARDPGDGGRRKGAVYCISGRTGETLEVRYGVKLGQKLGLTVNSLGRVDDDVTHDILATSAKNPVGSVEDAGAMEIFSGANPNSPALLSEGGAKKDRLGESSAVQPSADGFMVGAPGTEVGGLPKSGVAIAMRPDGHRIFTQAGSSPQEGAGFGSAVAALGDVDLDGIEDYAASAPFWDEFVSPAEGFRADVGRIELLSGLDGHRIGKVIRGDDRNARFGFALAGGIDLNRDGVPDLVTGNPGDISRGRRDAGSVGVYSGTNNQLIRSFHGRRGLETRVFAASRLDNATVKGFDPNGRRRRPNAQLSSLPPAGELSIAVLDTEGHRPIPGTMRVAIGTGHDGTTPRIVTLDAGQRNKTLHDFVAFSGFAGGVNVAAGDLDNDGRDELVAAQADSPTGNVSLRVFEDLAGDNTNITGWIERATFPVFAAGDTFNGVPIRADGANAAVGGLTNSLGREIAVAPVDGEPIVRIFTQDGLLEFEWRAYDGMGFSGVSLAVGNLAGNGSNVIVTAPMNGPALIRAFEENGAPFHAPGDAGPVSFLAFGESFKGGARVATADVDFDGRQEILVSPGPGIFDVILAFETDGKPVEGFTPIEPYGGTVTTGVAIAGTDRFLRK